MQQTQFAKHFQVGSMLWEAPLRDGNFDGLKGGNSYIL